MAATSRAATSEEPESPLGALAPAAVREFDRPSESGSLEEDGSLEPDAAAERVRSALARRDDPLRSGVEPEFGSFAGAIVLPSGTTPRQFEISFRQPLQQPEVPPRRCRFEPDGSLRIERLEAGSYSVTIDFTLAGSTAALATFDEVVVPPGEPSSDRRLDPFDPRSSLRSVAVELVAADGASVAGGSWVASAPPAAPGSTTAAGATADETAAALFARARAEAGRSRDFSWPGVPFTGDRFELLLPRIGDFDLAVHATGFRLARAPVIGSSVRLRLQRPLRLRFRFESQLQSVVASGPGQPQFNALDEALDAKSATVETDWSEFEECELEFPATGSWGVRAFIPSLPRSAPAWHDLLPTAIDESSDGRTIELQLPSLAMEPPEPPASRGTDE